MSYFRLTPTERASYDNFARCIVSTDAAKEYARNFGNSDDLTYEVKCFMQQIKKAMPRMEFLPVGRNYVLAYLRGNNFLSGVVGIDTDSEGKTMYMVYAQGINNGRYSYGIMAKSAGSTNITRAVTNAKKFLCPPTPVAVLDHMADNLRTFVRESLHNVEQKYVTKRGQLFGRYNGFSDETMHMAEILRSMMEAHPSDENVQFNMATRDKLNEFFAAEAERNDAKKLFNPSSLIYVNEMGSAFIRRTKDAGRIGFDNGAVRAFTEDEIPEEMSDRIAVLSMMEEGVYVEGVGGKLAPSTFVLCTFDIDDYITTENNNAE